MKFTLGKIPGEFPPQGILTLLSVDNGKLINRSVNYLRQSGEIWLKFKFDLWLLNEIKCLAGAKWEPRPTQAWKVTDNWRNWVALEYMQGKKPYQDAFDKVEFTDSGRPLYDHQKDMRAWMCGMKECPIIGEMGTGKTLAFIEAIEHIARPLPMHEVDTLAWIVAPKAALESVKYDFTKWKSFMRPRFMTYEEMRTRVENKVDLAVMPRIIVFDEFSKLRNMTAKRTQAAHTLATAMRMHWYGQNRSVYIWGLTGTPSPKDPRDWHSLLELTNPGFLKEGVRWKFEQRLAITKKQEAGGQTFHSIVTWKDNPEKCNICGETADKFIHSDKNKLDGHMFEKSVNEVQNLHIRIKNVGKFYLKENCLDLPEKVYRIINVPMSNDVKQMAQLVKKSSVRAIEALTNLRTLSDGFIFQNDEEWVPHEDCDGKGCDLCKEGKVREKVQTILKVPCPKDDVIVELIEEMDRCVIYAGFTATIDRIVELCVGANKDVIRVDGRGWYMFKDNRQYQIDPQVALMMFDKKVGESYDGSIVFVGHPGSAGMGLTLVASDTIIYYSNDFNAESRIQSEDRIHRPGSRGANIIDLIHLPTDLYVLNALKKKRDLQNLTMKDIDELGEEQA